jgi:folylpolyglutamate synthase/dihydropteroate synthase
VQQALERARALAKAETVVVITGSIYLVGEVMRSIGIEV